VFREDGAGVVKLFASVIIGAGQAGLAMSRELSSRGVDHLILERGAVANSWRTERWDSLTLLTPNWANGLPDAPYEGPEPDDFMPVPELVNRFEAYALTIDAPVQTHTTVTRISRPGSHYEIETSQGPVHCETLVLATGTCNSSKIPAVSTALPSGLFQTTPLAYKRPEDMPDGGVLIVGASASGVQLAREIHLSGRPVTLAVGSHTRLPRSYRGKDIEWWLNAIGMNDVTIDEIDDVQRARRTPSPQLIGGPENVDLNGLQDLGIEIVGRLADIRNGKALFSGGLAHVCASADLKMNRFLETIEDWIEERDVKTEFLAPEAFAPTCVPASPRLQHNLSDGSIRSVLWATGYAPDLSWLNVPVFDRRGSIRHHGGVMDAPGLYVMGLPFLRRRKSQQIIGAGDDASDLAGHLVSQLDCCRAA
jgi:putative flavoprotein involved in K+ transport